MPQRWIVGAGAAVVLIGSQVWGGEVAELGARLYVERCSACHGEHGRGDGPTAPALVPPPRDFGDAAFWKERTTTELSAVVKDGKPGTMMPPFRGVLSDAEIDAVVAYLRRFDPQASAAGPK
jgi:mono/diheme cytochrome c family protein